MMRRGKPGSKSTEHLQVIKGKKRTEPKTGKGLSGDKRPQYILLILLALFLLVQVLIGWVLGYFGRSSVKTTLLEESHVDLTVDSKGIVTFDEEVILAEQTGYVYFTVSEGERVPRGKEVAMILDQPAGGASPGEEIGAKGHLESVKKWLLGEQQENEEQFTAWQEDALQVKASLPGVVSYKFDGWERYGPEAGFPYLSGESEEAFETDTRNISQGEKVHRLMPVFKIIDNYDWYYSTVLPAEKGKTVAESQEVHLRFSFDSGRPVTGQVVEAEQDDNRYRLTWRIARALDDFHNQRLVQAEIQYDRLDGTLVPSSALVEKEEGSGVYVVEKGVAVFQEVSIISEIEGDYLAEDLEPHIRVVTTPGRVREGQRLY